MREDIRYFQPDKLVEVTTVTLGNRYLMSPSPEVNKTIAGVVGKAQRKYEMTLCDVKFMSSHYHLLTRPRDSNHLARFMGYVNTNLSKELGKVHKIRGSKFEGPYHAMVISDEEEAQVARLRYLISNSVKEDLVERPEQWPGVQGVTAVDEAALTGRWYNRTREYAEKQRSAEAIDPEAFATDEEIVLSPLPCWEHLSSPEIHRRVAEIVEEVVGEAARERRRTGHKVRGVKKILATDPLRYPPKVERSPQPRFYAFRKSVRKQMWEALSWVQAAFREAAERLRAGDRGVAFPEGTHPPSLPFVPFAARGQPA